MRQRDGHVIDAAPKAAFLAVAVYDPKADDGPGIPPRLAERLFEPFVSSKSSDGSGLGLTISRELAALHGGDLRLVETDGTGAAFELRLPG